MPTSAHVNVLPFDSFSMILGMDWLYLYKTKVVLFEKAIECVNDSGEKTTLQGKKKPTSVRMVTAGISVVAEKVVLWLQYTFLVIRIRRLRMLMC